MLASSPGLASGRGMGGGVPPRARLATGGGSTGPRPRGGGQLLGPRPVGGAQTGPNPTDRGRAGSKHHLLTDANGVPLVVRLTAANVNDVTQLLPLVDRIPRIRGKRGRPRHRPGMVQGDRGYDSQAHRRELQRRGIRTCLARRGKPHGSGLGKTRWVVERSIAWLHQFRRLRIRWERRVDIHEAFLWLACILIAFRTPLGL